MTALSIAALSVVLSAQAGQNTYDPASGKAPSTSQDSFLDFTLKRINPASKDYGKCLEEGRALLLEESIRNGYFWSNLVALSLLGCLLLIILYQHRLQTRRDRGAARIVAHYEQALARSNAQVDQIAKSNHGLNDALAAFRESPVRSTLKPRDFVPRALSSATEDRASRPQPASPPPRASSIKPVLERGANIGAATRSAPQIAPSKLDADIVARINLLEQQLAYAQEENKQLRQRVAEGDRTLEPEHQEVANSRGHRPRRKGRTMMSSEQRSLRKPGQGMLNKFEPAGESGPLENPIEREERLNELQLPTDEKELALESARLADLCQYFSQEKMDIPADLLDRIGKLSGLQPGERVRELLSINQALMEYLNRVGSGPQLSQ